MTAAHNELDVAICKELRISTKESDLFQIIESSDLFFKIVFPKISFFKHLSPKPRDMFKASFLFCFQPQSQTEKPSQRTSSFIVFGMQTINWVGKKWVKSK